MIFSVKRCAPISVASLLAVSSAFGATAFINQIGYRSNDAKEFTIADASGAVKILDASGQVVLSAAPSEVSYWAKCAAGGFFGIETAGNVFHSNWRPDCS